MAVEQLQKFTNNATTTVPATISNVATSVIVNTGTGALFPSLSGSLFFVATIVNTVVGDPGYGQLEIVKVTARSSDTMTIQRAQEGTTAKSFPAGCVFELRPTAQAFDNIYTEVLELESTKATIASPTFTGDPKAPTPTLGDNDTSIANTAYVQTAFNTYGDRHVNMVINPHGSIQQETTSGLGLGGFTYIADQWVGVRAGGGTAEGGVFTSTISAYDPSNLYIKCLTTNASPGASDGTVIIQLIEGLSFRRMLYGGSSARGSWLRWRASASQSGTASVAIRNGANNRSFVQSFAVTNTPTDYSLFIPGDTTGTWVTNNTAAASITFTHSAGSSTQTSTLGAWQAGNFIAANTQSNMMDTVGRQLHITDVQWTDSPILMPFVTIDYQQELARCQRYYWKDIPGTVAFPFSANGFCYTTSNTSINIKFPVVMRVAPTADVNNVGCATASGTNISASSFTAAATTYSCGLNLSMSSASFVAGNGTNLVAMTTGAYVAMNARM